MPSRCLSRHAGSSSCRALSIDHFVRRSLVPRHSWGKEVRLKEGTYTRSLLGSRHRVSGIHDEIGSRAIPLTSGVTRYQAGFQHMTSAEMSTAASLPTDSKSQINQILDFWFQSPDVPSETWFRSTLELDDLCSKKFSGLVRAARSEELDSWTSSPQGTLALILLLDQFPRNIYRESAEAHASDEKAVRLSTIAVSERKHLGLRPLEQFFLFMPLMHDERLISQIAWTALVDGLATRVKGQVPEEGVAVTEVQAGSGAKDPIGFVKDEKMEGLLGFLQKGAWFGSGHMEVIRRFGRFPSRNKLLGRKSTVEEELFLDENPSGFPST